jgi:ribosomal protein S18 acetylase RimI-like enzyme
VQLRGARRGDEAAIAEVHIRSWQAAYRGLIPDDYLDALSIEERSEVWRRIIDESTEPGSGCIVVEEGGRIVGFAHLCPCRDEGADPGTGELTTIYLLKEHWHRGLGRALLEGAVVQLSEAGFGVATLWVLGTNVAAQRFYEATGWVPDGATRINDFGAFSRRDLRYRRELPRPG